MRKEAQVRSINREEAGTIPVKSIKSASMEASPASTTERTILSAIRDMERMMEDAFHRPFFSTQTLPFRHMFQELGSFGEITPSVDVFEEKDEVVVKAELPGIKREDISVKLVDNNLFIAGEKKSEEKVERKDFLRLERSYGSFNRTLSLPEGIDTEHVKAAFKDGVLEVRIPKGTEAGTVRQVKID